MLYPHRQSNPANGVSQQPLPLIVLTVFCVTVYFAAQTRWQVATDYMRWSDELLSVACLLTMFWWIYQRKGQTPLPHFLLAAASLYCFSAAGQLALYYDLSALGEFVPLLYAMLIFPLLVGWLCSRSMRVSEYLLFAWLLGAAVSALVAVFGKNGMSFLGIYHDWSAIRGGRIFGLAFHPNSIGYISSLTLPVAIYFLLTAKRFVLFAMAGVAAAALLYAVYGSGSRTSLVAGLVGLAPFAFYVFRGDVTRLHVAGLAFILVALVAASSYFAYERASNVDETTSLARILGTKSSTEANLNRLARLRITLDDLSSNTFWGQGYNALTYAHNVILQSFHAGGVLGLAALLVFMGGMVYCWIALLRYQERNPVPDKERLLLWTIASCGLIWFLSGLTHNYVSDRNAYVMFGVMLGLWFRYQNEQQARLAASQKVTQKLARKNP